MAVINLYRLDFDTYTYQEDKEHNLSDAMLVKYRKPIYTAGDGGLYQPSLIRARYGEDYVNVCYTEIDDSKWVSVDWSKVTRLKTLQ